VARKASGDVVWRVVRLLFCLLFRLSLAFSGRAAPATDASAHCAVSPGRNSVCLCLYSLFRYEKAGETFSVALNGRRLGGGYQVVAEAAGKSRGPSANVKKNSVMAHM